MMNINVKVNVKVTNGTFLKKKAKKKHSNLVIFWNKFFLMFPEYNYKSFGIFSKIIIATI